MEVEVNYLAVVLAAISAMIVGGTWYAKPVFGAEWMKLTKISEKKAQERAPRALAVMFVLALIMAFVLAHTIYLSNSFFSDKSYFESALQTAFWLWLGFLTYGTISNGMFEQRPNKLIVLNAANQLVTIMVMAVIIGLIGV